MYNSLVTRSAGTGSKVASEILSLALDCRGLALLMAQHGTLNLAMPIANVCAGICQCVTSASGDACARPEEQEFSNLQLSHVLMPMQQESGWLAARCQALPLADAGLFSFPPKTMQHNFLSRFKPVFYIRQRDYSKVGPILGPPPPSPPSPPFPSLPGQGASASQGRAPIQPKVGLYLQAIFSCLELKSGSHIMDKNSFLSFALT